MPLAHRRNFVRTLTLALGASAGASRLIAPRPALAGDLDDKSRPKDQDQGDSEAGISEVDARMELVLARFGKQLDAEARKSVRSEVEAIVHRAEALRKIPLSNGDGPFPVFKPYRAPLA